MDCWACGEPIEGDPLYHEEDEHERYPLCEPCNETVDVRLLVIERIEIEVRNPIL